jgi:anti-sigma B factor antagonist
MQLLNETRDGVAVISVVGEYGAAEAPVFGKAVEDLAKSGKVKVVVSLEKLTFIDSTSLGSLIRAQEGVRQGGGDLACAALSKFTAKNFRLLGIDQRIRCFPTVDEAAAWLRSGSKP